MQAAQVQSTRCVDCPTDPLHHQRHAVRFQRLELERQQPRRRRAPPENQTFTDNLFVFTSLSTKHGRVPDHTVPYSPSAVTQRYADMAARIKIKKHLRALRHYSATELLAAGIDLRTVAGRLSHGAEAPQLCAFTPRG